MRDWKGETPALISAATDSHLEILGEDWRGRKKCSGKRGNSKPPRLVDLCLGSPIVTVPLAAKELRISQQAATTMIDELSSNLRELTGRG